ncbi:MAG: SAM-dependent chlorinase/fluorinase [Desulfobacterales bacterium]|jgi:S-adenosylmethionine hydrolase|nr:SAM-dependent chlorinase/fluorinase [Desulfobacterales bacterium]
MAVITLLTDFGFDDAYVGIMKGVILSKAPSARIVDISHRVLPHNLLQAAFLLDSAYAYFPKGTVHTVVVDPGVGGNRAIIAVEAAGFFFLAPNNGVLTPVLNKVTVSNAMLVENHALFLEPVSRTFHGRDIFAPIAAYLSEGGNIRLLGPCIAPAEAVRLEIPEPVLFETGELIGTIIDMDRFGNLITNISKEHLKTHFPKMHSQIFIRIGKTNIAGLSKSYSDVSTGYPLAVIGSRGYLEISINCGSAKDFFSVTIGEHIAAHMAHNL